MNELDKNKKGAHKSSENEHEQAHILKATSSAHGDRARAFWAFMVKADFLVHMSLGQKICGRKKKRRKREKKK